MDIYLDDGFVIFVRTNSDRGGSTECPLATCSTYADAKHIRRQLPGQAGEFVIRYVGTGGGGD